MGKRQDFLEEEGAEQNRPLIRLLHDVYQPGHQDARSMARIRQRLLSNGYPQTYTRQKTLDDDDQQKLYEGVGSMNSHVPTTKSSRSRQRRLVLVAIAAVLSFVLVLGFLVVTLNLTRRPSLATTPTPAVIPTTSAVTPTPVLPHTPTRVMNIHMINSTTGWILCADGSVLRTTDGGLHWVDVTPPALLSFKQGLGEEGSLFPDSSTAWIVVLGNSNTSYAFHTSDAGQTWQEGRLRTNESTFTSRPSYEITAVSTQEAWALETRVEGASDVYGPLYGMTGLYHTTDGGKTWTQTQNLPIIEQYFYSPAISFTDQHTGIITGNSRASQAPAASVYLTRDSGASWRSIRVQSPDPAQWKLDAIFSPHFLTSYDGTFTASFQSTATQGIKGFSVFSTHNGGQTWISSPIVNVGTIGLSVGISFFDTRHGYILVGQPGNLQLYVTSDGGQHWNSTSLSLPDQKPEDQAGLPAFISPAVGWLILASQPGAQLHPTSLYTTVDGGQTWIQVHAHFPSFITPKSAY